MGQPSLAYQNDGRRVAPQHQALAGGSVLVVDDEPGMRNFLQRSLEPKCALVQVAASAEEAEALRQRFHFDLMIVDIRLPGGSGIEWLDSLRKRNVRTDVILITAYADLETAIAALRIGAVDFVLKPFRLEQILAAVQRCLEQRRMARENFVLRKQIGDGSLEGIIGNTATLREMLEMVQRVAETSTTVLIEGETGTGKELVARALHNLSLRRGAFVPVNCGSISPELFESELFGHTRGAFTGATGSREGLFSYAQGGTLFLDEISEMPPHMQAKLLRVLEEKAIRPVGSDRHIPTDVRVIVATNCRLGDEVTAGRFREDLFFRLNVVALTVPPLRERVEDIPALADHFISALSAELGTPPLLLAYEDMRKLQSYQWPGNVRELKNVIERSLLLGRLPSDSLVSPESSPRPRETGFPLEWTLAMVEKTHMLRVLESTGGNKSKAARKLGVSRKTLERKLKDWAMSQSGNSA